MPPEAKLIFMICDVVGDHDWACGPAVPEISFLVGGSTGVGGIPGRTGK